MACDFTFLIMKKILLSSVLFSTVLFAGCGSPIAIEIPEDRVLVEKFSDLQCPACAGASPLIKKLRERFGNDIEMRFKHFPLEQIHPNAFRAAEAAECAKDQGDEELWEFVEGAYQNQSSLVDETFRTIASDIGLDTEEFSECLSAGGKSGLIRRDMKEGRQRGVNATPTLFINGEKVENRRYEDMVLTIEALLEEMNAPASEEVTEESSDEE